MSDKKLAGDGATDDTAALQEICDAMWERQKAAIDAELDRQWIETRKVEMEKYA